MAEDETLYQPELISGSESSPLLGTRLRDATKAIRENLGAIRTEGPSPKLAPAELLERQITTAVLSIRDLVAQRPDRTLFVNGFDFVVAPITWRMYPSPESSYSRPQGQDHLYLRTSTGRRRFGKPQFDHVRLTAFDASVLGSGDSRPREPFKHVRVATSEERAMCAAVLPEAVVTVETEVTQQSQERYERLQTAQDAARSALDAATLPIARSLRSSVGDQGPTL